MFAPSFFSELQNGKEFFNCDRGVTKNATKGADGNFSVEGNRNRKAARVRGMAETDVAALLANRGIAKFAQGANQISAR